MKQRYYVLYYNFGIRKWQMRACKGRLPIVPSEDRLLGLAYNTPAKMLRALQPMLGAEQELYREEAR